MKLSWVGLTIASSLAMGFGLGAAGSPFVVEAWDTPIGSFVVRFNVIKVEPLPNPLNLDPADSEFIA